MFYNRLPTEVELVSISQKYARHDLNTCNQVVFMDVQELQNPIQVLVMDNIIFLLKHNLQHLFNKHRVSVILTDGIGMLIIAEKTTITPFWSTHHYFHL